MDFRRWLGRALRGRAAVGRESSAPPSPASEPRGDLASVDLARPIAAVDPRYMSTDLVPDPFVMRCSGLAFARGEGRLYVIYAGSYLFSSNDGVRSLHAASEVNTLGAALVPGPLQAIDALVETMDGTILVVGNDARDGG